MFFFLVWGFYGCLGFGGYGCLGFGGSPLEGSMGLFRVWGFPFEGFYGVV